MLNHPNEARPPWVLPRPRFNFSPRRTSAPECPRLRLPLSVRLVPQAPVPRLAQPLRPRRRRPPPFPRTGSYSPRRPRVPRNPLAAPPAKSQGSSTAVRAVEPSPRRMRIPLLVPTKLVKPVLAPSTAATACCKKCPRPLLFPSRVRTPSSLNLCGSLR